MRRSVRWPGRRRRDIEKALDAAHAAAPAWGKTSAAERAVILNKIADRIEANLETIALRRVVGQRQADPGDAERRHPFGRRPFRYFAAAIRAQEGSLSEVDGRSPITSTSRWGGGSDHPVELSDPDGGGSWPRPAAGNAVVLAGRADPASIMYLISLLIADLLPAGVGQRGQRIRGRGRQAAGLVEPDRQDRRSPARPPPGG